MNKNAKSTEIQLGDFMREIESIFDVEEYVFT